MKLKSLGLFFVALITSQDMSAKRVYFYHDFHETEKEINVVKSIIAGIGATALLALGYKLEQKLEKTARATIANYDELLAELKNYIEYCNINYGFKTANLHRYFVPNMPKFYENNAHSAEAAQELKRLYYGSGFSYTGGAILLFFALREVL